MQHIEASSAAPRKRRRPQLGQLLANHTCGAEIADDTGTSERSVRRLMDHLKVPYIKFGNVRWYDRDQVRAAMLASAVDLDPRGRGRPRKAPAAAAEHPSPR